MELKKRLVMTFKTNLDKRVSISVDSPREDLTEQEIKTAMDTILAKDIFSFDGQNLATAVEAKVIETGTTEYDLVIG